MKTDKFKTFTASMIAIVTVLSALVAWRAALASQSAGDADFSGLVSTVNNEEARVLDTIRSSEHYQAFLIYTRYNELGYRLYDDLQTNPADADQLRQQKSDVWGLAYGLQTVFFPSRYLLPDGTYDSQREMDELLADDQRSHDTRADLHFSDADTLRRKANWLVGMLIVLGISFWFFTLAQIVENHFKYVLAVLGGFFVLVASFSVLVIELSMRAG
jgi:hypothetical protein